MICDVFWVFIINLYKKLFVACFTLSEIEVSLDDMTRPYFMPRQQSGGNIQFLYLF